MRHKIYMSCAALAVAFLFAQPGYSQTVSQGNSGINPSQVLQQDPYQRQMAGLMEEMKTAKAHEARKAVLIRMRQVREEYRVSHPVKEPTPAERATQRQKMEQMLQKDPFQWQMYQLRRSILSAKTQAERDSVRGQMQALRERRSAEEESRLTATQKAERQARQQKSAQVRAELKPLMEQLRSVKTPDARRGIQAQMMIILDKYR